jgi:hypothetical protein
MHPFSQNTQPRIDIFYGRTQMAATDDVMTLAHQSIVSMQRGEHILLINSLCGHDALARSCDKIAKGRPGKVIVYSASGSKLREKFEFLSTLIVAKDVKMLVVNSFEFAACGSRQKHALAHWLREMRDAHNLRVVVYSYENNLPEVGALNALDYTASSVSMVGAWKIGEVSSSPTATDVAVRYADAVEEIDNEIRQKKAEEKAAQEKAAQDQATVAPVQINAPVVPTEKKPAAMTMPRRALQSKLNLVPSSELLQTLKTNDLTLVGAHPSNILETVEEEDYAMAA